MTAEVSGRSTPSKTKDVRLGEIDDPNAGALHNPTIESDANELANINGKRSFRTIVSTFWCETTEERNAEFERVVAVWPTAKYILYGPVETSEENKKNHVHCIFAFASSKLWKTIIKTLPTKLYHHEKCRKFNDAREYCLKTNPDDKREYGTPLKQGVRTDIKQLVEKGGYNPRNIREIDPALYSRYRSGINDICNDHQHDQEILDWLNVAEDEDGNIIDKEYVEAEVHWYYGSTGTGKSRTVKELIRQDLKSKQVTKQNITIIHKIENGFAIGSISDKTDILVLDEFRGSCMKFSDLLSLIDGCSINVKGGKQWIKAKKIYITSCFRPEECYPNQCSTDSINQLLRRIKVIQCLEQMLH